jgi:hypothetical protein
MTPLQSSLSSIASVTTLASPTALPAPDSMEPVRKPALRSSLRAGGRPRAIVPRTLEEAMAFARAVIAARMAPSGFETPEACMIAILHGMEVGLTPLSALQRIAVIGGRPTIWGDGAMALVRASGLAASIEERIEGTGPSDWVGVCCVRRKGDAHPVERRFSAEDAKRARLWGKTGPWSEYPQRMLQMRARAFALRDVFADVLGGLYLREEIEGEQEAVEWRGTAGPEPAVSSPATSTSLATEATEAAEPAQQTHGMSWPSAAGQSHSRPTRPKIIAPPPPPVPPSPTAPVAEHVTAAADTPEPRRVDEPQQAVEATTARRPAPDRARPRPALAERRRLSSTREARRLRLESGWAIRRPSTLAPRLPVPRPAGTIPTQRETKYSSAKDTEHRHQRPRASPEALDPAPEQGPETVSSPAVSSPSPHDVLGLYDDALSCALDEPTLTEIVEELGPRLTTLDREAAAQAERILARHRDRIEVLAMLDGDPAHDPSAGSGL